MTAKLPWCIHHIGRIYHPNGPETPVITTSKTGRSVRMWSRAIPEPYPATIFERFRAAWWVLTGRAVAMMWPKPGEIEHALWGKPDDPRPKAVQAIDTPPLPQPDFQTRKLTELEP